MSEFHSTSKYSEAMGFRVREAANGQATLEALLADHHMNTRDVCHGGVISGLMDMAAGVAVRSRLADPERPVATVSLTINYERPGALGEMLVARARVRSGRRLMSCEIEIDTSDGKPIATGLATLAVR